MTVDFDAIHADYEAWQKAHQSFDTDEWHLTATTLAGWIPDLLAEVQRLTDSEDSRVVVLEAENERLRDELGSARDWEAWEKAQKRIAELEAAAAMDKPVIDAARAWRNWFPSADSMFVPENALIAAVDALRLSECVDETADGIEEDLRTDRKLPVCADCGHRHRWGGECAGHSWTDSCPYDANGDCDAADGLSSTDTTTVDHG